jgi:hypothetical protein|uniref:Uncharacterized protein n=1 Tax=viral metagenome TaxID=1070528 RepID=A0A6C0LHC3_9ZZZZ|tara:strand:+ start:12 stop:293 length:282 start_codon:yes stop_codon:yes gene_type:complete
MNDKQSIIKNHDILIPYSSPDVRSESYESYESVNELSSIMNRKVSHTNISPKSMRKREDRLDISKSPQISDIMKIISLSDEEYNKFPSIQKKK